jgi:hypothetical protein
VHLSPLLRAVRLRQLLEGEPADNDLAIVDAADKFRGAHRMRGHADQTTHTCGGAIIGTDPKTSALNGYLQSWDVPNLFATGATKLSVECRLQPDRHDRGADFLVAGRDPQAIPRKARSAPLFQESTQALEATINSARPAAITAARIQMQGGVPIHAGGAIVGAVGVSGFDKAKDVEIAEAAATAVK